MRRNVNALDGIAASLIGAAAMMGRRGIHDVDSRHVLGGLGMPGAIVEMATEIAHAAMVPETEEETEARRVRMAERQAARELRWAEIAAEEARRAKPYLDAAEAKRARKAAKRLGKKPT